MFNNVDRPVAITDEITEAHILGNLMSSTLILDVEPRLERYPKGDLLKTMMR